MAAGASGRHALVDLRESDDDAPPAPSGPGAYLLLCGCGKHSYVGATKDIQQRVQAHNKAKWTASNSTGAYFTTAHCAGTWRLVLFWSTRRCGDGDADAYKAALSQEYALKQACNWQHFNPGRRLHPQCCGGFPVNLARQGFDVLQQQWVSCNLCGKEGAPNYLWPVDSDGNGISGSGEAPPTLPEPGAARMYCTYCRKWHVLDNFSTAVQRGEFGQRGVPVCLARSGGRPHTSGDPEDHIATYEQAARDNLADDDGDEAEEEVADVADSEAEAAAEDETPGSLADFIVPDDDNSDDDDDDENGKVDVKAGTAGNPIELSDGAYDEEEYDKDEDWDNAFVLPPQTESQEEEQLHAATRASMWTMQKARKRRRGQFATRVMRMRKSVSKKHLGEMGGPMGTAGACVVRSSGVVQACAARVSCYMFGAREACGHSLSNYRRCESPLRTRASLYVRVLRGPVVLVGTGGKERSGGMYTYDWTSVAAIPHYLLRC